MKEEIRRIMKLVQEGKLSPEDAAELIDAFSTPDESAESGESSPPPPPPDAPAGDKSKDPLKTFVDFMEGIGKEVTESVDWHNVAKQVREGTQKGFEQLKTGVEKIRDGKVNWSWFSAYENRDVTLPLSVPEGKTLRIENPVGNVQVVGGQSEGKVRAEARIRGMDSDEAHEKAEAYTIIIEESDHQVLIRQPDVTGLSVDLHVSLDCKCPVEVRTLSGDVQMEGTGGPARVDSQSGDVSLAGIDGTIEVHGQSGDLHISNSTTPSATLEVKSGDIKITKLQGNLVARSASGDVTLKECSGKTLSVESVTGDVSVDLSEPLTGTVNIRTVNGQAEVGLEDGSDCRVSLSTLRGSVRCELELTDEARQEQHITGRLGAGTGALDVSAVNGSITMRQREHAVVE